MSQSDKRADKILLFLATMQGRNVPMPIHFDDVKRLYYVETSAGSSFEFEIYGKTREDVACRYLEHLHQVSRTIAQSLRFAIRRSRRQRRRHHINFAETLAAFAREHAIPIRKV